MLHSYAREILKVWRENGNEEPDYNYQIWGGVPLKKLHRLLFSNSTLRLCVQVRVRGWFGPNTFS